MSQAAFMLLPPGKRGAQTDSKTSNRHVLVYLISSNKKKKKVGENINATPIEDLAEASCC